LYITGGNADVASGGGIYADGASPLIRACHLYNNTASEGGGLSFQNSPRTQLLSNLIYNNVALHAGGGGIALNNSPWSTLANNVVRNNEADEYGGGLFVSESPTTTVANNQLFDNIVTQQTGGGIYVDSSSGMMLTVNEIYRNTSLIHGGGLYLANSASVVVEHNQIYSNTVLRDFDGSGGGIGIFTNFTVTVARNQIYQNRAHMGGGLHLQGGITGTVLADNEIYSNTANNGGGLYLSASSHAMLVNNLIHSNRVISYAGGGLFLAGVEDAILLNNVVLNNQLANDSDCGSGILFYESNASLWHTTIANNTGGIGAALCLSYGPSSASLTNTIIANQPIGLFVAGGNTAALDGVLWSGNQLNFGGYGQISVTHAITGAAAFIADGYHLTACSAAINAGLASAVPADIDGQARPLAGASDLGADEFSGGGTCQLVYLPLVLK
jgi:parallel beta-helix repeat protein